MPVELNASWTEGQVTICFSMVVYNPSWRSLKPSNRARRCHLGPDSWVRWFICSTVLCYKPHTPPCLFVLCWLQFLLPELPKIQQPRNVCDTLFAVLYSSVRVSQEAWVWGQGLLLAGQAAAQHIVWVMEEFPDAGPLGRMVHIAVRPTWLSFLCFVLLWVLFRAVFLPLSNSRGSSGVMEGESACAWQKGVGAGQCSAALIASVFLLPSFGVIPSTPLAIHTPLMPNQSIDVSLPLNTLGPVMKMEPLNNLQVRIDSFWTGGRAAGAQPSLFGPTQCGKTSNKIPCA